MMSFKRFAPVLTLSQVFNLRIALNDLSRVADVKGIASTSYAPLSTVF